LTFSNSKRSAPVQWLYDLQHFGIKLGLDNIRTLLELLDRPQRSYRTVIVGGTNGKGSVVATLAAMLDAHDRPAGMFTSPHLVHPQERIRLAGRDITTVELDERLIAMRTLLERYAREVDAGFHPSFFEVMTATALTAFRDHELATAVLEVGLGGRLDATNAVEADLSAIVTVDYDHMKTLGPSIEQIAREKAGIVKEGRPVVTAVRRPIARAVIEEVCKQRKAPLTHALETTSLKPTGEATCELTTPVGVYSDLPLVLPGRHQQENLRTALVILETLLALDRERPDPNAVRDGLANVRWAGRLDWRKGPPRMLFDAAHNAEGARLLAEYLDRLDPKPRRGVWLFGAMKGKQFDEILEPLRPFIDHVIQTSPNVARAADADELEAAVASHFASYERIDDPAAAWAAAKSAVPEDGFLLIAGSLYLVGEIMGIDSTDPVPGPVSM
jgi:dihydrofolate synthase/folylpolyglutamate synthase